MEADEVTHAWLSRRWLFGGPDRVLDELPWWPDPQLRLVRNEPELWRISGRGADVLR